MMKKTEFLEGMIFKIEGKRTEISFDNHFVEYYTYNCLLFYQDLKNKVLYVNYHQIWGILEKRYDMKQIDIQELIKEMVEKHLKIKGFTPWYR